MKCIGQLKFVTVWLVLLGFLCAMMAPSVSYAKVDREIDTEGDPGDGLQDEGGSGSSSAPLESPALVDNFWLAFGSQPSLVGIYIDGRFYAINISIDYDSIYRSSLSSFDHGGQAR